MPDAEPPDWSAYYDAVDRFDEPGLAVDLGCGDGRDTVELLRRGWRVVAIDGEPEAIARLRARVGDQGDRLVTAVARFEEAEWPDASLVNSSFALPFCPPESFDAMWSRVLASLAPGGRFSGQLFGDRDGWVGARELTFHSRAEAEVLFEDFDLERFDELEEDGETALGDPKHWHVFHVIARRSE